ncbi:MAG: UvrD-helicase domain-containing protein [Rugosibacter sp.]|jgi:DNA helicase-2/ATP-dependent DNA helicase PcrA|nr:DNA helicase II / ATP-dependent DNA helicase PcrA [Rugosibacter sp.]
MSTLLANLNAPQLAAVTLPAEHALILAGAGSGKTRVLTTRIAWLISTGQVSPSGILAVTFTNKAAKEMQTRLAAMLPINVKGMWIGTFHGLCNRLLRAHYRDAGLPQLFQILDSADQLSSVKRMMKALNADDEKFPPRELCHFINAQKEQGLRSSAVEAWDSWATKKVELYAAYEAQCEREGVVDFAELLLRSYELLSRNEPLLRHYQERFRHILVDEFQDTNKLQYRWLKLLTGQHAALFCVGDDDQSIYAFRGADVGNMRDFEREFHVKHMIRLEQNYRSHGNILDAANAIIQNNPQRLGKNLWTQAGSGEPIRVYEAYSDNDEARWIVEEVKALVRDGQARADMALLYRSNAQSRALEHALFNAGIPYRVYGGLRFFERAEIKHALAYLRLIANENDDTAFARVVNFPVRGIGARSLESLQDAAKAANSSLYAAIPQVGGKGGASLAAFAQLIAGLRGAVDLPLPALIEHVIELSGLRAHYQNEKEGEERLSNLDELINAAAGFVAEEGVPGEEGELSADLAAFLAHASLEAGEHQAGEGDDALQLMTVHSAKGLEFDVVFISGLEEGLFPHENAVNDVKNGGNGLEEERRLMYVAVTRARQRLYLSIAQSRMLHGQTRYNIPSRFLDEIPGELMKWLTPKVDKSAFAVPSASTFYGRSGPRGAGGSNSSAGTAPGEFYSAPVARASARDGWRIGMNVHHAKFGDGLILNLEGSGTDARVQVNFKAAGMKWLALSVAKLEVI